MENIPLFRRFHIMTCEWLPDFLKHPTANKVRQSHHFSMGFCRGKGYAMMLYGRRGERLVNHTEAFCSFFWCEPQRDIFTAVIFCLNWEINESIKKKVSKTIWENISKHQNWPKSRGISDFKTIQVIARHRGHHRVPTWAKIPRVTTGDWVGPGDSKRMNTIVVN